MQRNQQKPMAWFAFKTMSLMMNIRKIFRNIDEEINLAGIQTGDYILDFGCGLGFNTFPAAKKVGNNGKVFALDINPHAIKMIREKSKNSNLENIEVILSDCDTNLEDRTIDIVYLHNTFPIVKDKQRVLDEIQRILKVGGKLSYMSRTFSRAAGKDSMNGERLKNKLETDNKFRLVREKNGHLIFEKLEEKNT